MNLQEISQLILLQVQHNNECGKDDKFTIEEITNIIQRRIINVLEPEGVYEKGVEYDGVGVYVGIVDTYPFGENYFKRQHHFIQPPADGDQRKVSTINEILIREIQK